MRAEIAKIRQDWVPRNRSSTSKRLAPERGAVPCPPASLAFAFKIYPSIRLPGRTALFSVSLEGLRGMGNYTISSCRPVLYNWYRRGELNPFECVEKDAFAYFSNTLNANTLVLDVLIFFRKSFFLKVSKNTPFFDLDFLNASKKATDV
jgi:hypothetical protein